MSSKSPSPTKTISNLLFFISIKISSLGRPNISTLSTPELRSNSFRFFDFILSSDNETFPDNTILVTVSKNSPTIIDWSFCAEVYLNYFKGIDFAKEKGLELQRMNDYNKHKDEELKRIKEDITKKSGKSLELNTRLVKAKSELKILKKARHIFKKS